MEFINEKKSEYVNRALLDWFSANKRSLSFREEKDAYKILVSEIMAQQTRIETLLPYFDRFITRFPDVETLASAPEESVVKAWEGLGYYSRARNLHKAAKIIQSLDHFPSTYEELIALPGIGTYTAGAVMSIAYNQPYAAVDGNVLRVMSRVYASELDISKMSTRTLLKKEIEETIPESRGDYTESLMELGALICLPKNPKCMICPVKNWCLAHQKGLTDSIPVKGKKKKPKKVEQIVWIITDGESILLEKRPETGLLSSMNGFPITEKKTPLEAISGDSSCLLGKSQHVFSHIIWESEVRKIHTANLTPYTAYFKDLKISAVKISELEKLSIPTAFKKIIDLDSALKKEPLS